MRKTKLGVLEMAFFEKWKHLCWPKHTTERTKKTKLWKGFWKTKQNRKPQKTKIIDEKKPFKCIFSWNKHKETRQTKTTKTTKETINKKTRKKTKKTRNKIERDREWKRKSEKTKEKQRETLRNEQNNPFSGENNVFVKDKKHKILRRVEDQQPQNTRARFFLLSLWSPHGHVSSSYALFIAKVSLILFFLLLVFCFSFLGGCVSFFVSMLVFIVRFAS